MRRAVIAVLAGLLAAGCSAGGHQAASPPSHSPAASSAPASTAAPSPSVTATPRQRMTRKEAARAYVRIWDPSNRDVDRANTDEQDRAPFSQFRADLRAFVADMKVGNHEMAALLWPRNVEPYVKAMLLTYSPAQISCTRAQVQARSYAASDTVYYTNADCQAIDSSNLPNTIRSRLGLPPLN
jgi:hypothetical protein